MYRYEQEQKRLLNLWKETEEEEAPIGSESDTEEDYESGSNHSSGSEEDSDGETIGHAELEDDISNTASRGKQAYYFGKNRTKWSKICSPKTVRTRKQNIVTHLPGVKRAGQNAKTPLQCFELLFDNQMIDDIVQWTNVKLQDESEKYDLNHKYVSRNTDRVEIRALFGLLYLAGTYKAARLNLEDLFATDGSGIEKFRKTMSLQRFSKLLFCLRFDNIKNREERRKLDKLAAIRAIFDKYVQNSQNVYTPSEYLTIDEKLEAFRGRCAFRQYMPNKPARYGLKIFGLVDAKTYYVLNLEVYVGVQPDGPYSLSNKPFDVVNRLVAPVSGTGRNITFDNWFTSYEIMLHLLEAHNLTAVGTLRKNKAHVPESFKTTRGREECSTMFGFQENIMLISYAPRKNKIVLLLSTFHLTPEIDEETGDKRKPEVVTFYNATKSGVDVVDELSASYDVSRNSKRWPLTIFFTLLNCAAINAMVIHSANTGIKMPRRKFLKELAYQLIDEYAELRSNNSRLPRDLQTPQKRQHENGDGNDEKRGKRHNFSRRCVLCPRNVDRKTFYTCLKCNNFVCLSHCFTICHSCKNDFSD